MGKMCEGRLGAAGADYTCISQQCKTRSEIETLYIKLFNLSSADEIIYWILDYNGNASASVNETTSFTFIYM